MSLTFPDVLSSIKGTSDEINRINRSGEELEWPENYIYRLEVAMRRLGLSDSGFILTGTPGNYYLTRNGNRLEFKRAGKLIKFGAHLRNSLLVLGYTPTEIDAVPSIATTEASMQAEYAQTTTTGYSGFRDIATIVTRLDMGKMVETVYGIPTSFEELNTILNNDVHYFQGLIARIDEKGREIATDTNKNVGVWVSRAFTSDVTPTNIFRALSRHRTNINGCWIVWPWGERCLLQKLTCNGNTTPCVNQMGREIPRINNCGYSGRDPCFECLIWNEDGSCGTPLTQCTGGNSCGEQCANDRIEMPSDEVNLQCVNANFWGAIQDFFDYTLPVPVIPEPIPVPPVPIPPIPVPVPPIPVPVPPIPVPPIPIPPDEGAEPDLDPDLDLPPKPNLKRAWLFFICIVLLLLILSIYVM